MISTDTNYSIISSVFIHFLKEENLVGKSDIRIIFIRYIETKLVDFQKLCVHSFTLV